MDIMQPAMVKVIKAVLQGLMVEPSFLASFATFAVYFVFFAASAPFAVYGAPQKSGVNTPGLKIPIERLKPEAVYQVPGSPDWLAVDERERAVWVSNAPKDSVSRLDPATDHV